MKILNLSVILILAIITSCNDKTSYENCIPLYKNSLPVFKKISGTDFILPEAVMRPTILHIEDSILLLKEEMDEHLLHAYNLRTRQKTNACLSFGNGPGEFLYLQQIQSSGPLLWLSDIQKASITAYDKNDILLSDSTSPQAKKNISLSDHFRETIVLPDGRFIATVFNSNHKRLSFYDEKGNFIETKGAFPYYGESLTPFEQMEGFSCSMILSPYRNGIFLFYKQTDLIELYDLNGNLKKRWQGPDFFYPVVRQTGRDDMVHVQSVAGQSRDGYISPLSANGKVYVLYSGAYFDRKHPQYLRDQLFIFDNEGNPLSRYKLDQPIFTFTIDPATNKLYGLSDDPEFHLIEYQL